MKLSLAIYPYLNKSWVQSKNGWSRGSQGSLKGVGYDFCEFFSCAGHDALNSTEVMADIKFGMASFASNSCCLDWVPVLYLLEDEYLFAKSQLNLTDKIIANLSSPIEASAMPTEQ